MLKKYKRLPPTHPSRTDPNRISASFRPYGFLAPSLAPGPWSPGLVPFVKRRVPIRRTPSWPSPRGTTRGSPRVTHARIGSQLDPQGEQSREVTAWPLCLRYWATPQRLLDGRVGLHEALFRRSVEPLAVPLMSDWRSRRFGVCSCQHVCGGVVVVTTATQGFVPVDRAVRYRSLLYSCVPPRAGGLVSLGPMERLAALAGRPPGEGPMPSAPPQDIPGVSFSFRPLPCTWVRLLLRFF